MPRNSICDCAGLALSPKAPSPTELLEAANPLDTPMACQHWPISRPCGAGNTIRVDGLHLSAAAWGGKAAM